MDRFPQDFTPENKETFKDLRFSDLQNLLRKNIYNLVLKGNENDFFDLVIFDKQYVNNMNMTKEMCQTLIQELESLGWKTKLSYGNTGLFIYSTEDPPSGAW